MSNQDNAQPIVILMADDDADDRFFTKEAFQENRIINELHFVKDGVELLEFLNRQGEYANKDHLPMPDLILLDLNMPRKDGRETLQEIKADPKLRTIPVVILTTSSAEEDIVRSYELGAAGYITKPIMFDQLVEITSILGKYFVQIVKLPPRRL